MKNVEQELISVESLKKRLRYYLKMDVELLVNENLSTMVSLLERTRVSARLSIHKIFLEAPESVISAMAHYVRGKRKEAHILRQYIQDRFASYDYSYLLKQQQLQQAGNFYNLSVIYTALNEKYFNQELELSITWYGRKAKQQSRTCITFGQYVSGLRLIRIHRMLDHPFFPEYFVNFVIYHEMLHSVITGSLDGRGRYCFHGAAFKEREKAFEQYTKALEWEKNNKQLLFKYGWT